MASTCKILGSVLAFELVGAGALGVSASPARAATASVLIGAVGSA
ncbi:hypothetical protein ACWEQN_36225 [Streptomyces sp. NPDC004129]